MSKEEHRHKMLKYNDRFCGVILHLYRNKMQENLIYIFTLHTNKGYIQISIQYFSDKMCQYQHLQATDAY